MRRREVYQERGPQPPPAPPVPDSFAIPQVYAEPGHCPKCGAKIGRVVRAHALECRGRPQKA